MNLTERLWPAAPPGWDDRIAQPLPTLSLYPVPNARGAVLVLPGGAYQYQADHEGEPVARRMNADGFFAAVLEKREG